MKIIIFLFILVLLSCQTTFAAWTKIAAVPSSDIVALVVHHDTLYAASDFNQIYVSPDSGNTWNAVTVSANPIDITSLIFFNNILYVGTFSYGVFYSSDNGITWQNNGIHPRWISEFSIHGNVLYASSLGNGVARLDTLSNNWVYFNASLPSYSVNVNSIVSASNDLIIAAGANGTFYRYDFINSIWNEEYYDAMLHPGLMINKLISNANTIFAVDFNRIIRSDNSGVLWSNDDAGTHVGFSRTIVQGSANYYTLTNMVPAGTWIQERNIASVPGTTWAVNEELLPTGFSYAILEFNNKLYLGKDDGLYTKNILTGLGNIISAADFKIYPNPSADGTINIKGNKNMISIEIINNMGQVIQKERVDGLQFQTKLPKGIYYFQIAFNDGFKSAKAIVAN
jgi:hypothetical protein